MSFDMQELTEEQRALLVVLVEDEGWKLTNSNPSWEEDLGHDVYRRHDADYRAEKIVPGRVIHAQGNSIDRLLAQMTWEQKQLAVKPASSFTGVAHVGYIPAESGKITGLSKLARLVDVYAKRPQVQERLTTQVADALMRLLEARGVIVVIEAEHLCMTMRGVKKAGARTITSAVRGAMRTNPTTRAEAMALIHRR